MLRAPHPDRITAGQFNIYDRSALFNALEHAVFDFLSSLVLTAATFVVFDLATFTNQFCLLLLRVRSNRVFLFRVSTNCLFFLLWRSAFYGLTLKFGFANFLALSPLSACTFTVFDLAPFADNLFGLIGRI